MALRKVAVLGHPVLRKVAEKVPESEIPSEKIQTLIRDMFETMFEYQGRGLAAPQVHESLQIVVMIWDFDPKKEPTSCVLINPAIKPLSEEKSSYWEGCLSFPGLRGKVSRPTRVLVHAFNEKGEALKFIAEGFAATVIQHECDHLMGKLYIDRMADFNELAFNLEYERYHAPSEDSTHEKIDV